MSERDELWNYPYEGVCCHRRMSRQARAAQFAPFAALEGYEEAVAELDQVWQDVCRRGLDHSRLRITYFQEDLRKRGGTWRTEIIQCRKIDRDRRYLITQDGQKISLDCICQVSPE